jgi:hypothetical protein
MLQNNGKLISSLFQAGTASLFGLICRESTVIYIHTGSVLAREGTVVSDVATNIDLHAAAGGRSQHAGRWDDITKVTYERIMGTYVYRRFKSIYIHTHVRFVGSGQRVVPRGVENHASYTPRIMQYGH